MTTRAQILVRGIVQGVGFRPFVYSHASRMSLNGRVRNNPSGVLIDVEGEPSSIDKLVEEIGSNPPPLSHVDSIELRRNLEPLDYSDFLILDSSSDGSRLVSVSADFATCDACLRELLDPEDRRYRYPFINCTNCGPRFTIIEDVPYDRENTTMRCFQMCDACRREYQDPSDRRFHAEPTACHVCGPKLSLLDHFGRNMTTGPDEVHEARELILAGNILAIKGIGGFHLACDALSAEAVHKLRERKFRYDKPFALMANSDEIVRRYCDVSASELELLNSGVRPVVLLNQKSDSGLPEAINPRVNTLGFMLPYTPLHHLLFENLDRPLVMTSGNVSDEPICYVDEDADQRLNGIADYFLVHDRAIHIRTDDSVTRVHRGREMIIRRSRGYAPAPIHTEFQFRKPILSCGAELKNTFCLARGHDAFISHHIGDLENFETLKSFTEGIEHFQRLFAFVPEVVAYDLHPDYLSTKYALGLDQISNKIGVQHHHAHIASCLADNGIEGEVIGVAMDGLGFGTDGKLWGGEFLIADYLRAERVAHLTYIPLPGGSKAIREPWRLAAVYLQQAFGDQFHMLDIEFNRGPNVQHWGTLRSMIAAHVNSPETSSMGRLFDAVAGLLCLRDSVNYEGQAAIELETIADHETSDSYEFSIAEDQINAEDVIGEIVNDLIMGVSHAHIAGKFHLAVARLILDIASSIRRDRGLKRVALSGGVFQNMLLLNRVSQNLEEDGFDVLTHSRVPPNDGGISLGQAAVANAQLH